MLTCFASGLLHPIRAVGCLSAFLEEEEFSGWCFRLDKRKDTKGLFCTYLIKLNEIRNQSFYCFYEFTPRSKSQKNCI